MKGRKNAKECEIGVKDQRVTDRWCIYAGKQGSKERRISRARRRPGRDAVASTAKGYPRDRLLQTRSTFSEVPRRYGNSVEQTDHGS